MHPLTMSTSGWFKQKNNEAMYMFLYSKGVYKGQLALGLTIYQQNKREYEASKKN